MHPAVYAMAYSALVINSIKVTLLRTHLLLAAHVSVTLSHACGLVLVNNWLLRLVLWVAQKA
jgi:hypothetical protein